MRRKVTVLTGPGDGGAGALRHRAFLFRPNSEAVGPICSKRRLLWKSSGDPFVMWPPPPQAGRGAPVRRDKRRGIFLPGRSPYPALLHSPNSLPKVSFGEAKLRGFLSFYVSYHLFPGIYFIIKTQNPAISGLERSRCRSSQEITDSPTPFSALNYEEHPRPFGAGSPEGNPSFSDAPYRPPEYSRWQEQPGYWGNPGSSRSTAHTHRFWPAPQ